MSESRAFRAGFVALLGPPNVGKSSLLNALAQRRNLAKTSKTPGATRLINAFELAPQAVSYTHLTLPTNREV